MLVFCQRQPHLMLVHTCPCLPAEQASLIIFVYYEVIKRELLRRRINQCRRDGRLQTKAEGSTRLAYTGLCGGLEHLKIESGLIDERVPCVIGECSYFLFIMKE
jgi:hypothetical protein